MMRAMAVIGVSLLGAPAAADDVAVIDLTGVKLQDGLDQSRSSDPDTVDPSTTYMYEIEGMVQGSGVVFGLLFPEPTPLDEALESIQPGSSDFLTGVVGNPSGEHPVALLEESFEGEENLAGIDVTFAATFAAGIDADDHAWFSITDVNLEPSFLVGTLTFTEGTATVTAMGSCYADFNGDGALNILDFVAFQGAFQAGDEDADCDGNGVLNILDFVCFQGAFSAGCG